MAEKHTEEHSTPIKTPRQLIVVVFFSHDARSLKRAL